LARVRDVLADFDRSVRRVKVLEARSICDQPQASCRSSFPGARAAGSNREARWSALLLRPPGIMTNLVDEAIDGPLVEAHLHQDRHHLLSFSWIRASSALRSAPVVVDCISLSSSLVFTSLAHLRMRKRTRSSLASWEVASSSSASRSSSSMMSAAESFPASEVVAELQDLAHQGRRVQDRGQDRVLALLHSFGEFDFASRVEQRDAADAAR